MIRRYDLKIPVSAIDKLEAFLKGLGAQILSTEVLSKIRPRFTQLDLTSTYAEGIKQLQIGADMTRNLDPLHKTTKQDGSQIYRPLTFHETIASMVEDYNTLQNPDGTDRTKEERLRLLNHCQDSCTSVTSKARSTRFKINQLEQRLIEIPEVFNESFLEANYKSAIREELDTTEGIYNQRLTHSQVLEHKGWLTALEEDKKLLTDFSDIVFTELSERRKQLKENVKAMGFYVVSKPAENQLGALFVGYLDDDSDALGGGLNYYASFLLLAQKSAPQASAKKISTSI